MYGHAHPFFRRGRAIALRWMALSVLVFALPTTKQVVENALAVASSFIGVDDCGDDCGERSSSAPKPCQHCSCCAPRTVLSAIIVAPVAASTFVALERIVPSDVSAPGFKTPLLRPPAA